MANLTQPKHRSLTHLVLATFLVFAPTIQNKIVSGNFNNIVSFLRLIFFFFFSPPPAIFLFLQANLPTFPSLFIYGHSATGKSLVVNSTLQTLQLPHALVNCVECQTQRNLCESALNQIAGVEPSSENNYEVFSRCDNMNDFVRLLKGLVKEKGLSEETVYIVSISRKI